MNRTPNEEHVLEVGQANFESEVLASKEPVVVLFWAPRSALCRLLRPTLKEIVSGSLGTVKFATINCDENPELTLWYGVHFIPMLLCFIDGVVCASIDGTASNEAILAKLESCIRDYHPTTISQTSNEN